jgi:hypothetical protein
MVRIGVSAGTGGCVTKTPQWRPNGAKQIVRQEATTQDVSPPMIIGIGISDASEQTSVAYTCRTITILVARAQS